MMFTGYKIIARLGLRYELWFLRINMAIITAGLVHQVGIFKCLLIAGAACGLIHFMADKNPGRVAVKQYFGNLEKAMICNNSHYIIDRV